MYNKEMIKRILNEKFNIGEDLKGIKAEDLGISADELALRRWEEVPYFIASELYFALYQELGLLVDGYKSMAILDGRADFYDHREHLLDNDKWVDHWTMSADNIMGVMPDGAKVLNLCCGDGFYDKYFYSKRASEIISVDINEIAISHAKRLHSDECITYILADMMEYQPKEDYFDIVAIRGAIEHFTKDEQSHLASIAHTALKDGGYFCGDTPKATDDCKFHHYEWRVKEDGINVFKSSFQEEKISVSLFRSAMKNSDKEPRTTIFWRCKK